MFIHIVVCHKKLIILLLTFSPTPNILSCWSYRKFWTRFHNNTVSIGTGDLTDVYSVAIYQDTVDPYSPSVVSLSMWNSAEGTWAIPEEESELKLFNVSLKVRLK